MDYSRPELAERLAAEYVLGTLSGRARRRYQALLPAHPTLRQATADWERRLGQLALSAPPVEPSRQVWSAIERRLFDGQPTRAMSVGPPADTHPQSMRPPSASSPLTRWWQRVGVWQGATAFTTFAAVTLAVLLGQPAPQRPPIIVVMDAQAGAAIGGIQAASFVASVSGDGRSLVLRPMDDGQATRLPPDKALELWAVPAKGSPRSLGLVARQGTTTVVRASLLSDTKAFAVSVEPAGGSPSGAPTGPIISVGPLRL